MGGRYGGDIGGKGRRQGRDFYQQLGHILLSTPKRKVPEKPIEVGYREDPAPKKNPA